MTNRIIAEQATGPRGISVKLSGYRESPLPCHGKNKQLDPARNFQILDVTPNRAVDESFKLLLSARGNKSLVSSESNNIPYTRTIRLRNASEKYNWYDF